MKILIAGCGYVGQAAARLLRDAGHTVLPVTFSAESAKFLRASGFDAVACDITNRDAVRGLPCPDVFVHCAAGGRRSEPDWYRAIFLGGCRNLMGAFPGSYPVFTSSTSVYSQTDGSWVTENSPAEPTRETGRILRETEEEILAGGGAALRLAGLYGPGRSVLFRDFLRGGAQIDIPLEPLPQPSAGEPPASSGRWINQLHRDDAATAIVHMINHRHRSLFNVADSTPLTQLDLYSELSRRFNRPLPPERPPATGRKRAWTSKRVSNAKLHAAGWVERFPSWFNALDGDPELLPSILAQVQKKDEKLHDMS